MNHGKKEYAAGMLSMNAAEGFWGHFKRMVFGTYHFVNRAYLQRYVDEAVYRWNTRRWTAGEHFADMFAKTVRILRYWDVKVTIAA